MISIKRIYEEQEKSDGYRILVDRLWPRGITKSAASIDLWMKNVAPSTELRAWFHKDKTKRFEEFQKRYNEELFRSKDLAELRRVIKEHHPVTLITAVKDIDQSHIPTLRKKINRVL